ncbi:uncharacterized protein K452DRAFT_349454 [Aplosporella prunicola CBS 121167]|uniref:CSN8/PSMD8/EIF3K domain-containing protein n=1 Tax=Aplosporella prunicola CBS 121167 TaxID=1176127 RepID=A0A6A6BRH6_9PEZI|nr:uncharacterized protein K452DRAFT_349454 [Aplosporella prunicola CBS 121167]KAF2145171.1 hypothetical protein K452DRAFT_349454 [Aplosporella prunicola CBS 121167]
MTAQQRPSGRRGPSMQWSRLKPGPSDPLEAYGLPSKGETRLNDFRTQETYYNKIVERYMKFCAASGGGDKLDAQFAAMSLAAPAASNEKPAPAKPKAATGLAASKYATTTTPAASASAPASQPAPSSSTSASASAKPASAELATILAAMRKLREAITASHRTDRFAQRAYIFLIHAAILTKAWEAYLPALLYLLQDIHGRTPMASSEFNEFAGYHILDLACRQGDLAAAFERKSKVGYGFVDPTGRVERLLRALVLDDWVGFWRVERLVDGYQKRIMEFKEEDVRLHALKCIGRSYLGAEKSFVERSAGTDWDELVKSGVGWELTEGNRIVIRRPKAK